FNLKLLHIIETLSKKRKEKVFLVGGIVRDFLLGINNKDIDIVVEGNGIEFAKDLKKLIKADNIRIHEKFKTAVLTINNEFKLDIASSRIEYYECPGCLPIVYSSDIKADMYRRDFTINAMAFEIDNQNFGKLIDFYNGYQDLKERKIRILHNLSFVDDPTRIIRAIRFASRYNFDLEENTEFLLINAINKNLLSKISWDRLKQEFKILFSDKNIEKSIEFLDKYNILKEIHPNIVYNLKIRENIIKLQSHEYLLKNNKVKKWILVLLIISENLKKEELIFVLKKFDFSKKFISKFSYETTKKESILKKLMTSTKNSEIYSTLEGVSIEFIILIYIQTNENKIMEKIEKYLYKLSKSKPLITGKDLIELGITPGKEFKKKLDEYFMKQLDLELPTKNKLLKG
ncbi:MAG: tRNA nucleotidyltransferase, partial [Fusobacteria bacterium]